MSLPWFRFYREVKDDPKMGELDDATFRVFVECLCWACECERSGCTGLKMDGVNWAFRRNVTETLQKLLQKQVLHINEAGELCVTNWEKRQMSSDSSTERVRKYRAKQNETLQKRPCNGAEERRVDKSRVEESKLKPAELLPVVVTIPHFKKPTLDEIKFQCAKIGLSDTDGEKFFNYQESKGWKIGNSPMKSWPHALTTWKLNKQSYGPKTNSPQSTQPKTRWDVTPDGQPIQVNL